MPRPGPRRRAVPLRLSEEEERPVRQVADNETGGNLSDAIRRLLAEAIAARQGRRTDLTNHTEENPNA